MEIKIESSPDRCRICKKDISKENSDCLTDNNTGERYEYCEDCFNHKVVPKLEDIKEGKE